MPPVPTLVLGGVNDDDGGGGGANGGEATAGTQSDAVTGPWSDTAAIPASVKSDGAMPLTAATAADAVLAEVKTMEKNSVVVCNSVRRVAVGATEMETAEVGTPACVGSETAWTLAAARQTARLQFPPRMRGNQCRWHPPHSPWRRANRRFGTSPRATACCSGSGSQPRASILGERPRRRTWRLAAVAGSAPGLAQERRAAREGAAGERLMAARSVVEWAQAVVGC